jgi:DNA-binding transcriptional ArsR family regulator
LSNKQEKKLATATLSEPALARIAGYFQALSEPSRLKLLNLLCHHDTTVGELANSTGLSSANVSRHLSFLAQQGFIKRETRGNSAIYKIIDKSLFQICDLVCERIAYKISEEIESHSEFSSSSKPN